MRIRFSPSRIIACARSGSVFTTDHGAADCRYSLPITQIARNSEAALRTSIAAI